MRSDLAVKIFGTDRTGRPNGRRARNACPARPTSRSSRLPDLPLLRVIVDRAEIARYGLTADEVLTLIHRPGRNGRELSQGTTTVRIGCAAGGTCLPRSWLSGQPADPTMHGRTRPASHVRTSIRRFWGPLRSVANTRRIVVETNIRGRDPGIRTRLNVLWSQAVTLPPGYELIWGGNNTNICRKRGSGWPWSCR